MALCKRAQQRALREFGDLLPRQRPSAADYATREEKIMCTDKTEAENRNMQIRRSRWHWRAAPFAVAATLLLAGSIPVASQDKRYPELDQQLTALRNQFNSDTGKVRVLFIGDPTCPPCRHGASVIQQNVVSKFSSDKLAVYVVWVPLLNLQDPATLQRHAHQYASLIPSGPRVTHYSDPGAYVGKKYGPIIAVPYGSPAWDVYFAFDANARWGDTPPMPNYWEHQLGGMSQDQYLDGPRFAEQVRKLLAKIGQ